MKQTNFYYIILLVLNTFIVPHAISQTVTVPERTTILSPATDYNPNIRLKAGKLISIGNLETTGVPGRLNAANLCFDLSLSDGTICTSTYYDTSTKKITTALEDKFKKWQKIINDNSLEIWGVHLPYSTSKMSVIDDLTEANRSSAETYQKELIRLSIQYLKPKVIVAHPGDGGIYVHDKDNYTKHREASRKSISAMQSQVETSNSTHSTSTILCIENCMREVTHDALSILDYLDCETTYPNMKNVRVCLDTGHALIPHNSHYLDKDDETTNSNGAKSTKTAIQEGDVITMLRLLGKRIGTLHIQQNIGLINNIETRSDHSSDIHVLPFKNGLIDWGEFYYVLLKEIGYRGCFLYEVDWFNKDKYKETSATIETVAANYNLPTTNEEKKEKMSIAAAEGETKPEENVILSSYENYLKTTIGNLTNYPTPQSHIDNASIILPKFFKLRRSGTEEFHHYNEGTGVITNRLEGHIKRVIQRGNYSIVLTQDTVAKYDFKTAQNEIGYEHGQNFVRAYYKAHLYIVYHEFTPCADIKTATAEELSKRSGFRMVELNLNGVEPRDGSAGFFSDLSDIAITADGYLMGISNVRAYKSNTTLENDQTLVTPTQDNGKSGRPLKFLDPESDYTETDSESITSFKSFPMYVYLWNTKTIDALVDEWRAAGFTLDEGHLIEEHKTYSGEDDTYLPQKLFPLQGNTVENGFMYTREDFHVAGYNRADIGYTMAFSGNLDGGTLTYSAVRVPNYGEKEAEQTYDISFVHLTLKGLSAPHNISTWNDRETYIDDNQTTSKGISVTKLTNQSNAEGRHFNLDEMCNVNIGMYYLLSTSPLGDNKYVIDANGMYPTEFSRYIRPTTTGNDRIGEGNNIVTFSSEETSSTVSPKQVDIRLSSQPTFFNFAKRAVMISPYEIYDAEDRYQHKYKGVKLFDVTKGLDNAKEIKLLDGGGNNIEYTTARLAKTHCFAVANIETTDLSIHLFTPAASTKGRGMVMTLSTKQLEQSRAVFAYDLEDPILDAATNQYKFTFKTNKIASAGVDSHKALPVEAYLNIYQSNTRVGRHCIVKEETVQQGATENKNGTDIESISFSIACKDLANEVTVEPGNRLSWAIEVADHTVYNWQELHSEPVDAISSLHTVDKSPESPLFGSIYSAARKVVQGTGNHYLFAHDALWEKSTMTHPDQTNRIRAMAVDNRGNVYMSNTTDLYAANVSNSEQPSISSISLNSIWTYSTSSTPLITGMATNVDAYENTILAIHEKTNSTYNKLYGRKITANSSLSLSETDIFSSNTSLPHQPLADATIIPYGKGYFIGQNVDNRSYTGNAPNNHSNWHVIKFYDTQNSSLTNESDLSSSGIYGNPGGGLALTNDCKYIVLNNFRENTVQVGAPAQFSIFAISGTETAPQLTAKYNFEHNMLNVTSMTFDYAGNLIVSGDNNDNTESTSTTTYNGYFRAYAVPKPSLTDAFYNGETTTAEGKKYAYSEIIGDTDDLNANRSETPARSTFTLTICDGYDRVFTNKDNDNKWENPNNWLPNISVPHATHRVRLDESVTVMERTAVAGYIDILKDQNTKVDPILKIAPTGGLTVGGNGVTNSTTSTTVEGCISSVPTAYETTCTADPTIRTDRNKTSASATTEDAPLAAADIVIQAGLGDGSTTWGADNSMGSLALHNGGVAHKATVQIDKRYKYDPEGGNSNVEGNMLTWQYIGIPLDNPEEGKPDIQYAGDYFYRAWMYQWNEEKSLWEILSSYYPPLYAWQGYLLTSPESGSTYSLAGQLQPTDKHEFTLRFEGKETLTGHEAEGTPSSYTGYKGANFLANSWTAPIQISKFDATNDFINCEATIYLYAPTKRKYIALPIGTAQFVANTHIANGETHLSEAVINPMQGFFVKANSAGAQLKLDYDRLVSTDNHTLPAYVTDETLGSWAGDFVTLTEPASAPSLRRGDAMNDDVSTGETDEKPVMRIYVRGTDGNVDNVILIEDEAYTLGFDNGYDGRKLEDGAGIPYLTATSDDGDMAVLATPSLYGTFLNFRKGKAQEYTLTFDYNVADSDLVLQDLLTKQSVDIVSGNTYTFTATESEVKTRFRISHREDSQTEYEPTAYVANNRLYLENPTNELLSVSVFTVDGKLVQHLTTRDALTDLNVPNQGLYLIEITMSDKVFTIKQIL